MIYFEKEYFTDRVGSTETTKYYFSKVSTILNHKEEYICPICRSNKWKIKKLIRSHRIKCSHCGMTMRVSQRLSKFFFIRRGYGKIMDMGSKIICKANTNESA